MTRERGLIGDLLCGVLAEEKQNEYADMDQHVSHTVQQSLTKCFLLEKKKNSFEASVCVCVHLCACVRV